MRQLLPFTLPLFLLLVVAMWWSGPSHSASWRLVFSDEFDDGALDKGKWDFRYPRPGDSAHSNPENGEAQWYRVENVTEAHGQLRLTAERGRTIGPASGRVFGYTSGLIHSKSSFKFRYGYIEARMKLPRGSGFWPALWTWPSNEQWPPEIDVMESYGDKPGILYHTYHYPGGNTGSKSVADDWTTGWHTFGLDWGPTGLEWYVDDELVKRSARSPSLEMYVIANLAICRPSRCSPPQGDTPFPATLKVDFIRVWQR